MRFTIIALLLFLASLLACQSPNTDPVVPSPSDPTDVVIDNRQYPTSDIGHQRWTTRNYRGAGGIAHPDTAKALYGRYYTYQEAKAIRLPAGWRLPTQQDYQTLLQSQGIVLESDGRSRSPAIKQLLSITNWRTTPGNNASGFNAYPAGYSSQAQAPQDGDIAEFWRADGVSLSIQEAGGGGHLLALYSNDNDPLVRYSVRFVRDL